jgi:mannitol-1-/sugar-/sorbitol-6-phosphatase
MTQKWTPLPDPSPAVGRVTVVNAEALLFDLDGVLVDSAAAIDRHWREFANWYELDADLLLGRTHGRRAADTIMNLGGQLPVDPSEAIARYETMEVGDQVGVGPLPGAPEVLALLSVCNWAVVTSGSMAVAQARLKTAGLPEPPVLICAQDVVRGKPDPAPYAQGALQLGLRPERTLAVEDSPAGVESARAAGCATMALTTTHNLGDLTSANYACSNLRGVEVLRADEELIQLRVSDLLHV